MKGLCANTEIALRNGMQAHHEWSWDDRHLVRGKGVEFSIITIPHYCSRSERKLRLSSSARGGSRIFFTRGCTRLLLYFNTNKPHSFFFGRIPVVLENCRSSRGGGGGGGGAHPLHPPPRSAPECLVLSWAYRLSRAFHFHCACRAC